MPVFVIMSDFAAGVAELVDALDSKSSEGNFMGVRFPPPAPSKLRAYQLVGFFYVYLCEYFTPYTSHSTKLGILPEAG